MGRGTSSGLVARGLSLVVAGWLTGCGGALAVDGELLDAEALAGIECVAVMPLEDASLPAQAGRRVGEALAVALTTSERFNAMSPSETLPLVTRLQLDPSPPADAETAQALGRALGVDAVLFGTVTELTETPRDRQMRGPAVGFLARLVSSASGAVLWSASASHFEHEVLLQTNPSLDELLRDTAEAVTDDLVSARDRLAGRGVCAGAYARLEAGLPPVTGAIPESVRLTGSAATTPATSPPPTAVPPPAATPELPAMPPDLPAMPPEPGPSEPSIADLPPVPSETGLPDLPSDLPPIADVPPPKLDADAKKLARNLAADNPVELKGAFPSFAKGKLDLSPKVKRLVKSLAAVLGSNASLSVRVELRAPGNTARDTATLEQQRTAMQQELERLVGSAAARVTFTVKALPGNAKKPANVIAVEAVR